MVEGDMSDDFLNDELLDRLVDGELSADERRRVIAALEDRSDGWRRCALAFLEAQSWRGNLRGLVADATGSAPAPAVGLATTASRENEISLRRAPRSSRLSTALAIAASLLLAFAAGSQLRWPRGVTSIDGHSLAVAPPAVADRANPDADAVTLVLNDARGVPHRIEAPLVEGSRLGENFAEAPLWSESPELQRRLGEKGLGVAARRRYVPLYFEQQNHVVPMVVPVDDAVVAPVKRKVL
jgi:hypothetical protein